MGTPWWTGVTGTSGVNTDFHNTSDNLVIRLIEDDNGLLVEKNLLQYGRVIEEIAVWINDVYPTLDMDLPTWYLYDSELNGRVSGDGWELETVAVPPGTGFLTLRKLYIPSGGTSGFNNLINLDREIQNYYDDVADSLDRTSIDGHPSGQGFYQRFYGRQFAFGKIGQPLITNLSIDNFGVNRPPNADIDFLEGINYLRPKAPFFFASNDPSGLAQIDVYNILGPMFPSSDGIDNNVASGENLLCSFNLRDENENKLSGINAMDILIVNQGASDRPTILASFDDSTIRGFDWRGKQVRKYDITGVAKSMAVMTSIKYSNTQNPQVIINTPGPSETFDFSEFDLVSGLFIGIYFIDAGGLLKVLILDSSYNKIRIDNIRIEFPGGTRGNANIPGAFNPAIATFDFFENSDNLTSLTFDSIHYAVRKDTNTDGENRAAFFLKKGNDVFITSVIPKGERYSTSLTRGNSNILLTDRQITYDKTFTDMSSTVDNSDAFMILKRYTYTDSDFEFSTEQRTGVLLVDKNSGKINVKTNQVEDIPIVERTIFKRSRTFNPENSPATFGNFDKYEPVLFGGAELIDGPNHIHVEESYSDKIVDSEIVDEVCIPIIIDAQYFLREARHLLIIDYSDLIASGVPSEDQEIPSVASLSGVETYLSVDTFLAGTAILNPPELITDPRQTTVPTTLTLYQYTGVYPLVDASGIPIESGGHIDASTFEASGTIIFQDNIDIDIDINNPGFNHRFLMKLDGSSIAPLLRADDRLYILAVADINGPILEFGTPHPTPCQEEPPFTTEPNPEGQTRQSLGFEFVFTTSSQSTIIIDSKLDIGRQTFEDENSFIGGPVIYGT